MVAGTYKGGRRKIKESADFLSRLSKLGKIPEGALLCTVDVVGLYLSIPHGEAIKEALDGRENPGVAYDTLVGLASLVLENNHFEFNDRIYRQKLGTAIGTKFAPAYANLFMTRLEERFLEASADKPLVWMRFIDDVFFIRTHGEENSKSLINHLNSSHETIKFTSEKSRDSISFLDVQVSVGEGESFPQTCSASQLIHISTSIRSLVTPGIRRRRSPMVRLLGFVGYVGKIADFRRG